MADQLPIDDAMLGKFLAGETDPAESARVRQWLASRGNNPAEPTQNDFAKFERIWDAANPAQTSSRINPPDLSQSEASQPPAFDTNAAWKAVQGKMSAKPGDSERATDPVIKPLHRQRSEDKTDRNQIFYRIAAVLILATSFGWLSFQLLFMGHDHPAANIVTLVTADQKISKTLPDGTKILLNRHSTLTYPTTFSDDLRDVTLTGEAYFDVAPDAARPFRIQARTTVVQVLGTSFSVQAYNRNVSVAVRTGKVRFSGGRKAVLLTQNQQATFESGADTIRRAPLLSANAFAYKTGQLVFKNEPLTDVVKAINQFYNADVRLANDQLANCRLTTRFDKAPLDTVLNVTAETFGLHIRYKGRQVILEGAGCQ
ncbi:FecR family protein [Spirosoma sp.]|uniref:FecR family protein n=1 Tax=Spirosoma sp. TaxID=1899569 RepID=UPI003B3A174A